MKNILVRIQKIYGWFVNAVSHLQSPLLLAVRLYWGWQFAQNGWGKLHNLANVTDYFTTLGLPAPGLTAGFVSRMEFAGGILLGIGLFSRPVGLVLTIDMIMAYVVADREALLAIFSNPGKFYNADPYTFLFAALLILVFGPGRTSVDAFLSRLVGKTEAGGAGTTAI